MKKCLSMALAVVMIMSLFAVNVSAKLVLGEPEKTVYLVNQDFQDAEKLDLTSEAADGVVVPEAEGSDNNVAKLNATNRYIVASQASSISDSVFTVQFDVKAVNPTSAIDIVVRTDEDASFAPYGYNLRITYSNFKNAEDWSADTNWYTYSAKIDTTELRTNGGAFSYKNVEMKRTLKGEDNWVSVPYNQGYNYVTKEISDATPARRVAWRPLQNAERARMSSTWANGISIACDNRSSDDSDGGAWADNEYLIDNIKISYVKDAVDYPSTGILLTEDYEGTTKNFGTPTIVDGNNCLELYKKTEGGNEKPDYGSSETATFASLPQNFILTADVCMASDNTQPLFLEYFTDTLGGNVAGEAYNMGLKPTEVTAGEWYTMKLAKVGDFSYRGTLKNHKTGEITTFKPVGNSNISGKGIYNRLLFRIVNEASDADKVFHWFIDNIMVTEVGAMAISNIEKVDGAVSATVNVDAATTATPAKAKVFVAIYSDNRLVDIDFEDLTFAGTDGETANVDVEGEFDKVYLYLWNGTIPVVDKYDITALVK